MNFQFCKFFDNYFCIYYLGETEIAMFAYIMHQDTEGFRWVFKSYLKMLEVLPYPHPIAIITDGDKAIRAAREIKLPESMHLLCIWHKIEKNAPYNLKTVLGLENCTCRSMQNDLIPFHLKI